VSACRSTSPRSRTGDFRPSDRYSSHCRNGHASLATYPRGATSIQCPATPRALARPSLCTTHRYRVLGGDSRPAYSGTSYAAAAPRLDLPGDKDPPPRCSATGARRPHKAEIRVRPPAAPSQPPAPRRLTWSTTRPASHATRPGTDPAPATARHRPGSALQCSQQPATAAKAWTRTAHGARWPHPSRPTTPSPATTTHQPGSRYAEPITARSTRMRGDTGGAGGPSKAIYTPDHQPNSPRKNLRKLPDSKRCRHCERELPAAAFPANPKIRDGLSSWCRECHRAAAAASRAVHGAKYNDRRRGSVTRGRSATTNLDLGPGDVAYLESLLDDPCAYCGEPSTDIDHIVPGLEELDNLVGACRACNQRKGTLPLLGWLIRRRLIVDGYDELRRAWVSVGRMESHARTTASKAEAEEGDARRAACPPRPRVEGRVGRRDEAAPRGTEA